VVACNDHNTFERHKEELAWRCSFGPGP